MSEDREAFLDRWSRLKQDREREQEQETAVVPVEKADAEAPAAPLPPVEELNPDSDFTPFMDPKVDGETRRAALKKLFADPHFNVPDPFEAYSEDYTGGEPIPMEMLRTLNQAKKLLFDEPDQAAQAAPSAQSPLSESASPNALQAEIPPPEAKDVAGKQDA